MGIKELAASSVYPATMALAGMGSVHYLFPAGDGHLGLYCTSALTSALVAIGLRSLINSDPLPHSIPEIIMSAPPHRGWLASELVVTGIVLATVPPLAGVGLGLVEDLSSEEPLIQQAASAQKEFYNSIARDIAAGKIPSTITAAPTAESIGQRTAAR